MKSVPTFFATLYVGFKEEFIHSMEDAKKIIQKYVDDIGLCVTVTETTFVYTGGSEPGIIVGFINYPRFPSTPDHLRTVALELAKLLKDGLHQKRVSVMFPDETVMLGD